MYIYIHICIYIYIAKVPSVEEPGERKPPGLCDRLFSRKLHRESTHALMYT